MSISILWHGHATFSLDVNGVDVVVDPFFAPNNPSAEVEAAEIAADYILQTHGHSDHITDTLGLASRTGAQAICNFEICNWLNAQGHENTWAMNTGGGYDFSFGRVKMVPALHSSGLPDGSYGGDPGGFLLMVGSRVIYIAGDTALFSDMSLIGRSGIDLAILPVGDNFTMGPDDSIDAINLLKPKVVIPCHYNTWPPIAVDIQAWADRVRSDTSAVPVTLKVGDRYSLS